MKYLSSQRLIFQEKVEREIKNGLTEIDLVEEIITILIRFMEYMS